MSRTKHARPKRVKAILLRAKCDAKHCPGLRNVPKDLREEWTCPNCNQRFHAGCSGAADDMPEICDECWMKKHPRRGYTGKEADIGDQAMQTLSEACQNHTRECECDLCRCWLLLNKFNLLDVAAININEGPSVTPEEK